MNDSISTDTERMSANKTALVVIDLQNGTVNRLLFPHTGAQVVAHASSLIQSFTEKGAFVALVKVSSIDGKDLLKPKTDQIRSPMQMSEGWDRFMPELENFKNVYCITKRNMGAFYGTDLDLQLRRRGIDTIVLCGISTSIGVDTTAREAYQHGYDQIFVEDAMAASTKEEHDYVCRYIFPRMGRIRTTEETIRLLDPLLTQTT